MNRPGYVGRFAPSPTGPLHFGSLVAAIGSFADARANGGRWLVRIDDLDTPRNVPGAHTAILAELERLALPWDGQVHVQSNDLTRYRQAAEDLRHRQLAFPCGCSRKVLVNGVYPGRCRDGLATGAAPRALRLRVDDTAVAVDDRIQGRYEQRLESHCGDFVVLRADGIVAYHLATVLDDDDAGVTDVVRGLDLLESTPRQITLQRALGLRSPRYAHLPLAIGTDGRKLSKQNLAPATDDVAAGVLWHRVLEFLGQRPHPSLARASAEDCATWAIANWRPEAMPRAATAALP